MEKYILKESSIRPNGWVLTDTTHRVVITFADGRYNETYHVTMLDDRPIDTYNPQEMATIVREMGEYLVRYHSSQCFPRPYGFEYSEDDSKLYLYRRKHPRWRLMVEDDVNAASLASTLRKAAEYLTKGIRP